MTRMKSKLHDFEQEPWLRGEAIEVYERRKDADTEFDFWRPATVIDTSPLCVQFSDFSRLALHPGIPRRRPHNLKR
jgi:hypothetical protein